MRKTIVNILAAGVLWVVLSCGTCCAFGGGLTVISKFRREGDGLILNAKKRAAVSSIAKPRSKSTFSPKPVADPNEIYYKLLDQGKFGDVSGESFDFFARLSGEPRPLLRHRMSRGFVYNPSSQFQKSFLSACEPLVPINPLEGPLAAHMTFRFERPKIHYLTRTKFPVDYQVDPTQQKIIDGKLLTLRKDAPRQHTTKKDLDNLVKFVLDALNGRVYKDDCQISCITASKVYAEEGHPQTVEIGIKRLIE